LQELKITKK